MLSNEYKEQILPRVSLLFIFFCLISVNKVKRINKMTYLLASEL